MAGRTKGLVELVASGAVVSFVVMGSGIVVADEIGNPFADPSGPGVHAVEDDDLQLEAGWGAIGGSDAMPTDDPVFVILWDEVKPGNLRPRSGLHHRGSTGDAGKSFSAVVTTDW